MFEFLMVAVGAVGVPLIAGLFGLFAKRSLLFKIVFMLCKVASAFGQRKMGTKPWEAKEHRFQSTMNDIFEAMNAGLNADDKKRRK